MFPYVWLLPMTSAGKTVCIHLQQVNRQILTKILTIMTKN